MNDSLIDQIIESRSSGEEAVLATVVHTHGSTPRKAGAAMLIFRDGRIFGSVGGGCGEAEVIREALTAFDDGRPRLIAVDLASDLAADDGMVCGGEMQVFLEPL